MMHRLIRWAEGKARERQADVSRQLASKLRETMSGAGVEVSVEPGQIVLSGRGLGKRFLSDPDLRFLARGGQ